MNHLPGTVPNVKPAAAKHAVTIAPQPKEREKIYFFFR